MIQLILALSSVSLMACSHGPGKRHGDHHHKMWKKMDANNDGSVSKEEFDKAHGEMFTKMDANKDGKITKEERMAFKKSMKKDKGCCK